MIKLVKIKNPEATKHQRMSNRQKKRAGKTTPADRYLAAHFFPFNVKKKGI
jgi:hypothetical protein